ncbi:hypothetical protein ASF11_03550 [Acidovorax sp. Leaf76]|nr:hypothetical protein ASF11_03550 [Acidovorax sp. Leaf76]KQO40531.1 hypothetical protein ASF19_02590 [Acidovorax sp. Leaf84]KQS42674.1 hypothetical protein ASG27_02525 [Acidovorax sp. Leaf191]
MKNRILCSPNLSKSKRRIEKPSNFYSSRKIDDLTLTQQLHRLNAIETHDRRVSQVLVKQSLKQRWLIIIKLIDTMGAEMTGLQLEKKSI